MKDLYKLICFYDKFTVCRRLFYKQMILSLNRVVYLIGYALTDKYKSENESDNKR